MVSIAPFRGVMYNSSEINDHGGLLVAPPYDVLSEKEQLNCLNRDPHNILHLDYGERLPEDKDKYDWHQRSAELMKKWLEDSVLERLEKPAVIHVETSCKNPLRGDSIVRHGFICLMKLEEFSPESHVRPHEKTFSSHKEERLNLMKKTGANISQVFGFFPDEDRQVLNTMQQVVGKENPNYDFKDYRGFGHKIWIDYDEQTVGSLVEQLQEKRVYIADGHHRYETALNYRNYLKETLGDKCPASADYLMMYLCPMSDPGLVILPTHRMLHNVKIHPDEIINRLSRFFKISGKSFNTNNESIMRDRFLTKLKKQRNSIGLYLSGRDVYYVLKLLESAKSDQALAVEPKELAALDTVILNNVIFKEVFGLADKDFDNPEVISYISNLEEIIQGTSSENDCASFILNPATVEDILRVTERGLIMPRKSTFFYPKVTTGLVLNLID